MSDAIGWLFSNVIYTCHHCGARQRIPLRRVHTFERFHRLEHGEAVLIACPMCGEGVQTPSSYRTHNGYDVEVDPLRPPSNAFIHSFY
jgi:RNase P subunit RPR2